MEANSHGGSDSRQPSPAGRLRGAFAVLLKDAALYGIAGALNRVSKILLVPIVAKAYSAEIYGAFDALNVYLYAGAVLTILGLNSAVVIVGTADGRAATKAGLRGPASTSFRLVVLNTLLVAGALAAAPAWWSQVFLGDSRFSSTVLWAAASLPASAILLYTLSLLQWSRQRARYIAVSVGSAALTVGLTWYAAIHTDRGLDGFFIANLIGQGIGAVAGLAAVFDLINDRFDRALLRSLTAIGLPFAVIAIAGTLMPSIDRFFLVRLHSLTEVGLYGIGQKIAALTALALAGFQAAWGPFAFARRDHPDKSNLFARIFLLAAVAAVWLSLALTIAGPTLTRIAATSAYMPAAIFVGPLALSAGLGSVFVVVAIGSVMEGRSLHNLTAYVLGLAVTILANLLFGAMHLAPLAIAWANVLGQAVAVTTMAVLSQRVHPLPYPFIRGALIVAVGAVAIPLLTTIAGPASLGAAASMLLALTLVLALACWRLLPSGAAT